MEKGRKRKFIILIALMVAIASMSLGFAAFSSTLNISSSASVTPNSDDFKVVFSSSETDPEKYDVFGLNNFIEGTGVDFESFYLTSSFFKVPTAMFFTTGRKLEFYVYAHNIGEYDAYLRSVNISNVAGSDTWKVCTASTTDDTKATDSLVQAACDGIDITVAIDGVEYTVNQGNISGVLLEKGGVVPVAIIISYKEGSQLSDGPFDVSFGNISLEYGTADSVRLISFYIGSYSDIYYAEEGMTWSEWLTSSYNTDSFAADTCFCESDGVEFDNDITIIKEDVYYGWKCKS